MFISIVFAELRMLVIYFNGLALARIVCSMFILIAWLLHGLKHVNLTDVLCSMFVLIAWLLHELKRVSLTVCIVFDVYFNSLALA